VRKKRALFKPSRCPYRNGIGCYTPLRACLSKKRELHIAGMLLRRGIARVSVAEALAWVKSNPLFVRPDPDGKLLTTREVRDIRAKIVTLKNRLAVGQPPQQSG
jgi:hypothetical protein